MEYFYDYFIIIISNDKNHIYSIKTKYFMYLVNPLSFLNTITTYKY